MSKKITKKDEIEENVLNFINKGNRPYNYQMIEQAFPSMGKAQCLKTLKSLHEQGRIIGKEFNKATIYWKVQDSGPQLDEQGYEIPQDTMEDLDRKINSLSQQLEQEKEKLKQLLNQSKSLQSQQSDEEIQKEIDNLENENSQLQKKLDDFKSKSSMMTDAEKQRLIDTIRKARVEWVKRKRIFKDCLDQILEKSNKKKKDLQSDLDFQLDEDLKIEMIQDYSKLNNDNDNDNNNNNTPYKKQRK